MKMRPEERIAALLQAPPNGWVAFSEDEGIVIAYGTTYGEAVSNAEKAGVSDPLVVKVPSDWTELVLRN